MNIEEEPYIAYGKETDLAAVRKIIKRRKKEYDEIICGTLDELEAEMKIVQENLKHLTESKQQKSETQINSEDVIKCISDVLHTTFQKNKNKTIKKYLKVIKKNMKDIKIRQDIEFMRETYLKEQDTINDKLIHMDNVARSLSAFDDHEETDTDISIIGYNLGINVNVEEFRVFEGVDKVFSKELKFLYNAPSYLVSEGLRISEPVYVDHILTHNQYEDEKSLSISPFGILARYYRKHHCKHVQFINLFDTLYRGKKGEYQDEDKIHEQGKKVERRDTIDINFGDDEPQIAFYDNKAILLLTNNPLSEANVGDLFTSDDEIKDAFKAIEGAPIPYPYCDVSRCNETRVIVFSIWEDDNPDPDKGFCEYNVDTRRFSIVKDIPFCYSHVQCCGITMKYHSLPLKTLCTTDEDSFSGFYSNDNNDNDIEEEAPEKCYKEIKLVHARPFSFPYFILPSCSPTDSIDGSLLFINDKFVKLDPRGKEEKDELEEGHGSFFSLLTPIHLVGSALVRLMRDVFLLFDSNRRSWCLVRLFL